jgi:hypothetical protein
VDKKVGHQSLGHEAFLPPKLDNLSISVAFIFETYRYNSISKATFGLLNRRLIWKYGQYEKNIS